METPERSRRGRTTALIAGAAVLGAVAGVCTGYVVQAGRPPAQLPPLSQPVVHQAKGEVEPLTAAQDRRVKTDGDLRKLLLPRPKGARDNDYPASDDGWIELADYAEFHGSATEGFVDEIGNEFRRAAATSWRVGGTYVVEIRLVQYREVNRPGASNGAPELDYFTQSDSDVDSWPIPGTNSGKVFVHHKRTADGDYEAKAVAVRGDIRMEMWAIDTKPVPKEKIIDLAKRQVARL
ncbi:hypothetical protein NGF19_25865 [Streptomyces sp. RY43-2]|uniref:Serine/threonine protein kinase n=1 Tax=Streptomyces macrolidinus TaxID=2952607 RepID=A0ABT0ZKT1_9ACTN|nr:hypothetical protein [Streptomyces macrolidinus]MCN9244166.1 hypothetical protein [Streptomyces macrolidinus]